MINIIKEDALVVPKTIGYKILNKTTTLQDQHEVFCNPWFSFQFARDVPGQILKNAKR
jgi:hypothetical protein